MDNAVTSFLKNLPEEFSKDFNPEEPCTWCGSPAKNYTKMVDVDKQGTKTIQTGGPYFRICCGRCGMVMYNSAPIDHPGRLAS